MYLLWTFCITTSTYIFFSKNTCELNIVLTRTVTILTWYLGTSQGCKWSSLLFNLFVKDIVQELRNNCPNGIFISPSLEISALLHWNIRSLTDAMVFCLCLFRFVGFLFLLGSGKGCGLWLWHSLDFSLTFFLFIHYNHIIHNVLLCELYFLQPNAKRVRVLTDGYLRAIDTHKKIWM